MKRDSHGDGAIERHVGGGGHVFRTTDDDFEGGFQGRLVETRKSFASARRLHLRNGQPPVDTSL